MRSRRLLVDFRPWLLALILLVPSLVRGVAAADNESQPAEKTVSQVDERRKELAEEKELIRLFADTLEQVKSKYVESNVSERELIEAAIQGMISRLDPYSNYIPPQELDSFRKGVEREYVGIGIQVSERDGHLQIISPLYGTPAWRAGLRAGDRILKIGETSTRGMSIDESIKLMAGAAGTDVSITVMHPDDDTTQSVTLQRELIQQPTVLGYRRDSAGAWDYFCDTDAKIGYVRLAAFSRHTSDELARALKQLLADGMTGLVLDLRFNPGGMLNEAIQVSDLFVHEGRIVSVVGRSTDSRTWDAREEGTVIPRDYPVAVVVNRFSASAAEIVSACLQDHKIAVVVGERTWGKGSVQNIIELENGKSALKLTIAGYQRPSGRNIHRESGAKEEDEWGVTPDDGYSLRYNNVEMMKLGNRLTQLDALTLRETGDPADGNESDFVDTQMEKALEYLRGRIHPVTKPPEKEATDKANGQ